jgi:hypothetical protein
MKGGLQSVLAWVGFALLVWGAWLAFPRAPGGEPGRGLRVVLVDGSVSAVRRRPAWASSVRALVRAEASEAALLGQELSVVLVGRDILRIRGAGEAAPLGLLDPVLSGQLDASATHLDAAISGVELDLMDKRRSERSLTIIGDGEWSGPDPKPRIARLAREGVACVRLGVGPAKWPDLALLNIRLPRDVASGEALVAECELAYWPAALDVSGELALKVTDSSGTRELSRQLSLPIEEGAWLVSFELGPCADGPVSVEGLVQLRSSGALSAGDPVKENDRARGRTRVGGARLGLATASESRLPELKRWLGDDGDGGGGGFQWEFVTPDEVAGRLSDVDLLFSYDVSTASLPAEWLTPFLMNGGGWLAAGGWGLLTDYWPRGVEGSPPASALLPLLPAQADTPRREVIFCVDGSGSMTGDPFDGVRSALYELVRSALPSDELKLRFFTGALGPVIDLGGSQPDRVAGMQRLLATRVPGGSTAILSSMEQLVKGRALSEIPGLVLLLSDGMDDSAFDVEERSAALHEALAESRTQLTVIAIGAGADLDLLGHVAGGEEQLLVVEELDELSDLFRQEVAKERVREGELSASVVHGVTSDGDLETLSRALGSIQLLPGVERIARMEARGDAAVLLRTDEDLPLLGLSRVGGGWSAVFPSLLEADWALGYREAGTFWSAVFSFLARRPADAVSAPRLYTEGESILLRLGQDADSWPVELDLELLGSSEAGEPRVMGQSRLVMALGGGGALAGRRSGPLKLRAQGGGELWRAVLTNPLNGELLAELPFDAPLGQEFRPFGAALLPEGDLAVTSNDLGAGSVMASDPRSVAVIAVALILLTLAALLGRWRVSGR